jgi:hypothetical protein
MLHPIEIKTQLCTAFSCHILAARFALLVEETNQYYQPTNQLMTSQSVRLGFEPHLGLMTRY